MEDCKSGWKTIESKQYCANEESITWDEAQAACEKMGGNLASTLDSLTQAGVVDLIPTSTDRVYIGAHKVGGSWAWVDNSPWGEPQWNPGQPSGDGPCGEIIEGRLNDLACSHKRANVCQKK